jgi:hypothetical protein
VPSQIVAAEYISVDGAQRALFPQADRFEEVVLSLTPATPAQREGVASILAALMHG